jgi:hypothetical protein
MVYSMNLESYAQLQQVPWEVRCEIMKKTAKGQGRTTTHTFEDHNYPTAKVTLPCAGHPLGQLFLPTAVYHLPQITE